MCLRTEKTNKACVFFDKKIGYKEISETVKSMDPKDE